MDQEAEHKGTGLKPRGAARSGRRPTAGIRPEDGEQPGSGVIFLL